MLVHNYLSYAKINLGLQILNKREDGFHNLHSLFVEIDLADELVFTPSTEFKFTAEGSTNTKLPLDESNLISKSYRLIKSSVKSVPTEYAVHLKKQIPIGSGLGGGSSNAAATLIALNSYTQINCYKGGERGETHRSARLQCGARIGARVCLIDPCLIDHQS